MNVYFNLLLGFINIAQADTPIQTSWISLKNDYGYEFKYPECWKMKIDDPEEEGNDFKKIKNIFITEQDSCVIELKGRGPNHGISLTYVKPTTLEASEKVIKSKEEFSKIQLKNKNWLVFKKIKVSEGGKAIIYVDLHDKWQKKIRWAMELFCRNREFFIVGAGIENPSKELLQKFENGELAIPEPEKTIFESIRCIKPKLK